ncbi:SCF ubiquitin ligase complex subunit cdc4 [Conglomerata obtusa]
MPESPSKSSMFFSQPPEIQYQILKHMDLHDLRPFILSSPQAYKIVKKNFLFWQHKHNKNTDTYLLIISTSNYIADLRKKYMNYYFVARCVKEVRAEIDTDQIDITHLYRKGNFIFVSSDDQTVKCFEVSGAVNRSVYDDSTYYFENHVRKKKSIYERNHEHLNYTENISQNVFLDYERIYVGHQGGIWTFDVNDKYLVTGSTDKTVRVWDLENNLCVNILKGHKSTIRCLKIEEEYVISGSRDGDIRVWSFNGICKYVLKGHTESVRCLDVRANLLVTGSYDGSVILWEFKTGKKVKNLKRHTQRVYAVKIGDDFIVSSGQCGDIFVSDKFGNLKFVLKEHRSVVVWLEILKNYLISAGADGNIIKWNLRSGEKEYQIMERKHTTALKCYNGLMTVATNESLNLYDMKTGRFIRNLLIGCESITCLHFDATGIIVGCKKNQKTKLFYISYKQIV